MKTIKKISVRKNVLATRKRVAAYARVSAESERLAHSLSAQISYYSELIQAESGMGICRSICRQIHFRHTYGTPGRVPANDTGL